MQKTLLLVLLFSTTLFYGQFGENCELRQFKVNSVDPGIEYEMALGTNTTLDFKAGL